MTVPRLERELARIALITGIVCVLIGLSQLVLGAWATGDGHDAAVDTSERFAGGVFTAYGVAWLVLARTTPLPRRPVRLLALALLAGALGRLLSLAVTGWPLWWQTAQAVVETVVSMVVLAVGRVLGPPAVDPEAAAVVRSA